MLNNTTGMLTSMFNETKPLETVQFHNTSMGFPVGSTGREIILSSQIALIAALALIPACAAVYHYCNKRGGENMNMQVPFMSESESENAEKPLEKPLMTH